MMHRATARRLTLTLLLAAGGCGYFNSMYNARRQFAAAERAQARGESGTARTAYEGSIDKAAKSYRRYPRGRWADDALYLIARARFRLGEYPMARLAFNELLAITNDRETRAGAHAFAGAAALQMSDRAAAVIHLDSAIMVLDRGNALVGFAHLWRARARAANGDAQGAWADLDAVTNPDDHDYAAVQLERVVLALEARDSTRIASGLKAILAGRDLRRTLDTLNVLATRAAAWLGPEPVRTVLLAPLADATAPVRDSLALIRGQIALQAGDTLNGCRELLDLAGRAAAPTSLIARVLVAQARLRSLATSEQLGDVRALLLPAIAIGEAQRLIRTIRLVDVLVRHSAETGQPVSLFAAAEIARDELHAPQYARRLFVTYADIAPQTPWAGKALLAALALDPIATDAMQLRERLQSLPANPYTQVTRGEAAQDAYDTAEERLSRSLLALRAEASQLAQQQETVVSRAIAVLDSIAASARADTVRAACGIMIDTLALTGIRADSIRSACLRRDSIAVATYLKTDTVAWIRGATRDDSLNLGRRLKKTARDTVIR